MFASSIVGGQQNLLEVYIGEGFLKALAIVSFKVEEVLVDIDVTDGLAFVHNRRFFFIFVIYDGVDEGLLLGLHQRHCICRPHQQIFPFEDWYIGLMLDLCRGSF